MLKPRPWTRARISPVPLLLLALLVVPGVAHAQTTTVAVDEENFRATPGGTILARVLEGTPLELGGRQDQWHAATLQGWIWAQSVRESADGDHDLVVSAPRGENLRATPNGDRLGRLEPGTGLERVEDAGDWIRVRRQGWIWSESISLPDAASEDQPAGTADTAAGAAPTPDTTPPMAESQTAAAGSPSPVPADSVGTGRGSGPLPDRTPTGPITAGAGGITLVDHPEGDTIARVPAGAAATVVAREGEWVRVRVEGWALARAVTHADSATDAVLRDLGPGDLQAEPEGYRGRLVEWDLQFIALREAERFRTDFVEGEPYILAREPGGGRTFVYVAVPPDQVPEAEDLDPLQRFRVLGRIRTARSQLTGAAVIDMLELTPLR